MHIIVLFVALVEQKFPNVDGGSRDWISSREGSLLVVDLPRDTHLGAVCVAAVKPDSARARIPLNLQQVLEASVLLLEQLQRILVVVKTLGFLCQGLYFGPVGVV